jgi:hypothetical protein
MLNKLLSGKIVGASCLLFSTLAAADTTSTMSKEEWLGKIKEMVAPTICKSFVGDAAVNKQLTAANINYDKCVTLIPASYDKCQAKYFAEIPATIDSKSAEKWGNSLGECVGSDFAVKYFVDATPGAKKDKADVAASSEPADSPGSISKDVWLGKLKMVVPDLICKGFLKDESLGKQLATLKIDYNKCVTLIPPSVEKCQTELYASIPANIDDKNAETWGSSIGECIGKDFALKYLL